MKSPERNERSFQSYSRGRFWPEADSYEMGGLINSQDQGPLEFAYGSGEAPTL
jgi:hypothetical protein